MLLEYKVLHLLHPDVQMPVKYNASNVALKPPDGKEDASGSPLISSLPEKLISTLPFGIGAVIKESCFSAVTPVNG